jgi:two-component system chemotaxis response regulator CheY
MIVDDDAAVLRTLCVILGDRQVGPQEFRSVTDVVAACAQFTPDILMLDLAMSGFDAIDVLRALAADRYPGAVLLISGLHALLEQVMRVGERHGLLMLPPLPKPFRANQVERALSEFAARPPVAAA